MGYLHSKDIIHGRICSRNIFLEPKVQLSLLDYAVGQPNTQYSSPQLLSQECCRPCKSDDIFAFGTLIFELFGGQWTTLNKDDFSAAGLMAKQLETFPCTEKLKRIELRIQNLKIGAPRLKKNVLFFRTKISNSKHARQTQNTTCLSKVRRRFFQIFWPSQKTQILKMQIMFAEIVCDNQKNIEIQDLTF